jgi:hypothetical protein
MYHIKIEYARSSWENIALCTTSQPQRSQLHSNNAPPVKQACRIAFLKAHPVALSKVTLSPSDMERLEQELMSIRPEQTMLPLG